MAIEDRNDFTNRLAQHASTLLQDPLRDLTRRRQTELLTASIITLLLSLRLFVFSDGTFAGLKGTFSQPDIPEKIGGVITVYFLVVYVISVIQDAVIQYYRTGPSYAGLAQLGTEAARGSAIAARAVMAAQSEEEVAARKKEMAMRSAQTDSLLRAIKWNRSLNWLRIPIEVVFPIALAMFTIWVSLLAQK